MPSSITRPPLPFVRPDSAVVVGQSAGGWGAIAYDSLPHPKVSAFVVMAGGRGGHENHEPNENCRPGRLAEAAKHFGATASTPMLWVYAANDSYFAPPIARALYDAFTAAGGKAELVQPGPYDKDGHRVFLSREGRRLGGTWSRGMSPGNSERQSRWQTSSCFRATASRH